MQIEQVTPNDAPALLDLSIKTFFDAFAHLNNAANMEAYASKAFTLPKFEEELNNPDSQFYFALIDKSIAGYLKINFNSAQTELREADGLEVERIYVLQQYQRMQIGKQLLNYAIKIATDKKLAYVWLGVWDHNYKALKFYESNGFKIFGSHQFFLGEDRQTDLLMRKDI